ncbi:ComEC/Rec2 family competence protein [Mycobacterium sp. PS03-16]|uniref:ComEC/Rec2 family competence protein n=1 Tax=Mycobacterium sp. PS03-16 TaxID=2559611 RepID=UPI0010735C5C|nr:ComEC/Rec2 family competence protein [Mycobacterium sp. PS03-16]TFV58446.1 ComEC/Rec2 family competence protein [Mycobacterium sp. PS03-16]
MTDDASPADLRLVPAAVTGWAVTAAGIHWQTAAAVAAGCAGVLLTGVAAWWAAGRPPWRAVWPRAAAGLIAVAVVGAAFTVAVGVRTHQVQHHPVTAHYGTSAAVAVTPSDSPRALGGGRLMFRATLRTVDGRPMRGRVVVFASMSGYAEVSAGRPAAFRAEIGRPDRRDLTVAVLSAADRPVLGAAAPVQRIAHGVRTGFADAARVALPAEPAAMLPALVLGDTSTVPGTVSDEFRDAGLTHLTAVSGANVTIVCGAVLLSAALIGPRAAVLLAGLALIAFVVVVQPSASVLRAAVMGAITLVAMVAHRRRQAVPALAASVLLLLIAAPELAVDAGFALSVVATAGLVVIAPVWSRRLVGRGWPKPAADAVSVALAAQLVTAPLVAGISGRLSVVSVLANVAVAPVIPPITVIGTAAAALCPLWPAGAGLLIRFTGPPLWWLLQVADTAAALPGASVAVPSGGAGVAVVTAGGIAAVVAWRFRVTRRLVAAAGVCLLAWWLSGHAAASGVGPT